MLLAQIRPLREGLNAGCALIIRIKHTGTINPLFESTLFQKPYCFGVHAWARKKEEEGARGTTVTDSQSKRNGGGARNETNS